MGPSAILMWAIWSDEHLILTTYRMTKLKIGTTTTFPHFASIPPDIIFLLPASISTYDQGLVCHALRVLPSIWPRLRHHIGDH